MGFHGNSDNIKRVVLPSGKTIEIVSFDDVIEQPPRNSLPSASTARTEGLHVCTECGSKLVYPTDWQEEGTTSWYVELHCPNCDWTGHGVFDQELLDEFDRELDRGMEELAADLGRLARANMADDVDRFIAALQADAIQPMDF